MVKKVSVYVRVKPYSQQSKWDVGSSKLHLTSTREVTYFDGYDGVFHKEGNLEIYNCSIKQLVEKFLLGENGTVFAYGQTGSGKTYTFLGESKLDGVISFCFKDILSKGSVDVSYLELYNEKVFDLYNNNELQIYTVNNIPTVSRLSTSPISSMDDFVSFLDHCESNRKYGSTEYNLRSSRSHTIFQIRKETAVLNLIDLAGSERASRDEDRRKEGGYINRSLLALCNLVTNLQQNKYFGYRDSKLTRILQASLDGKTNIVGLCAISQDENCINESISTLKFAGRLTNLEIKVRICKTQVKQEVKKVVVPKGGMENTEMKVGIKVREGVEDNPNHIKESSQHKPVQETTSNDPLSLLIEDEEESILDSSDCVEFVKQNNTIDFNDIYRNEMEIQLLYNRIESLEKMIRDLLKKQPSKRFKEIFILEKHMFQLKLSKTRKDET